MKDRKIITYREFIKATVDCRMNQDIYYDIDYYLYYHGRSNLSDYRNYHYNLLWTKEKYQEINGKPVFDATECCCFWIDEFKLIADHLNPSNSFTYDELLIEEEDFYFLIDLNYDYYASIAEEDVTTEEVDEGPEGAPLWWLMQQMSTEKYNV